MIKTKKVGYTYQYDTTAFIKGRLLNLEFSIRKWGKNDWACDVMGTDAETGEVSIADLTDYCFDDLNYATTLKGVKSLIEAWEATK